MWRLSRLGRNLLILPPGEKTPQDKRWNTDASLLKTPGEAEGYLVLGYNIGYLIPQTGLIIDVDVHKGGGGSYDKLKNALDLSLSKTVNTPRGGFHIYTTLPPHIDCGNLRSTLPEYPGIDFLHNKRQVVVPDSSLADGRKWSWSPEFTFPFPPTPEALLATLAKTTPRTVSEEAKYLSVAELDSIMQKIPVDRYRSNDTWLPLLMACHHATAGEGLPVFLQWSLADPNYSDHGPLIERRWESMSLDGTPVPVTIRTLVKELSRHAPVPDWLLFRAALSAPPEQVFTAVDTRVESIRRDYAELSSLIEGEGDHLKLMTSVLSRVAASSAVTESMREVLYQQLAKKTGVSVTSIRKDVAALMDSGGTPFQAVDTDESPEEVAGANDGQKHTQAAKSAVLSLELQEKKLPMFIQGTWWVWSGKRWEEKSLAVEISKAAHIALYNQGTHATKSSIRSVVDIIETMLAQPASILDPIREEGVLSIDTNNYRIRLRKGEWTTEPHRPEHYITTILAADYDPDAPVPARWLQFLEESGLSGHAQRTIACMLIYSALNTLPWLRKSLYLIGDPYSGKSKCLNAIEAVLGGDSCAAMSMKQLGHRFGAYFLRGKLANISNEMLSKEVIQDDVFKMLVSGETIYVEPKYGGMIPFRNRAKLFFAANSFPRVTDESEAVWERLTIIPFSRVVPEELRDTALDQKLEAEKTSIFMWALRIFTEEYQKDRCVKALGMDPAGKEAMNEWKKRNNPALCWLEERADLSDMSAQVPVAAAYQDYVFWCKQRGHKESSIISFSKVVGKKQPRVRGKKGGPAFLGIFLRKLEIFS